MASRYLCFASVVLLFVCALPSAATDVFVADPDQERATERAGPGRPDVSGDTDGKHAWLTGVHGELIVRKLSRRAHPTLSIALRTQHDAVTIAIDMEAVVSVTRRGRTVSVDSPDALEQVQAVVSSSDAMAAIRALLAERESIPQLSAPEMSLLSSAAFVASLVGDVDAPRRLAARPVTNRRRIFHQPFERCALAYRSHRATIWDDSQACMSDPNDQQRSTYRRVACNSAWLLRSEAAWVAYLDCIRLVFSR